MLAFLRKTAERSDAAMTPEERILERYLVASLAKREQELKEKELAE